MPAATPAHLALAIVFRPATAFLAATLACASCAAAPPQSEPASGPSVELAGQRFSVELATTPAERAHGLMQRTAMPADHGMLFVFPDAEPRAFWMKNTLIPLDMLFFDAERRLVAIQADAAPCKANPCPVYASGVPARYVLELNAGTAAKLGTRIGDVITFSDVASGTQ